MRDTHITGLDAQQLRTDIYEGRPSFISIRNTLLCENVKTSY